MIRGKEALFESFMRRLLDKLRLTYGQKLFLLATLPLILAVAAISILVANQSRQLAEREIKALEILRAHLPCAKTGQVVAGALRGKHGALVGRLA